MKSFKLLLTAIFTILMFNISGAGVWLTSHADVDGDGVDEGIDLVVGVEGEQNIPYVYGPHVHYIAWNTSRTCTGVAYLRQVILDGDTRLLDTGTPTLINGVLYYVDKLYDAVNTYAEGNNVITRWVSQGAILERIVNLNDIRGVDRYKIWIKSGSEELLAGETGFLEVWNDGMSSIDQAQAYVLNQLQSVKSVYNDSFAGLTLPGNTKFKVIYIFDDYMSQIDKYSVLGWDGWQGGAPCTPTIWGSLFLPLPDSIYCESSPSPCANHAYIFWEAQDMTQASVRIEPRVINLKSHGQFTAFVTLPDEYGPADIDPTTVMCEGARVVNFGQSATTFIAKFNVQDLVGIEPGPAVKFTVTGSLYNGMAFSGFDIVRVIDHKSTILLVATPNPCKSSSRFTIRIVQPGEEVLVQNNGALAKIYNEAGILVRTLTDTKNVRGEFIWDINDDRGVKLPAGVYFTKITQDGQEGRGKLIVLP